MSDLTPDLKADIDGMTYHALLSRWRFAPIGHALLQGESGEYIRDRLLELRAAPGGQEDHVRASKDIGW